MCVELSHILCLPPKQGLTSELVLVLPLFARLLEPWVLIELSSHMHLEALGIFRLILTISYPCIVKLNLLNVAHIQMHPGKIFIRCQFSLRQLAGP